MLGHLSRGILLLLSILGLSLLTVRAVTSDQKQPPPEPGAIVSVPVLVLGSDGNPITDLNKSDLEIYQNNKQQTIESISQDRAAPATIGLLIDVSRSANVALDAVKLPADSDLPKHLWSTRDTAFVAIFSRRVHFLGSFSTDLAQISQTLAQGLVTPTDEGSTAMYDAIYEICQDRFSAPPGKKALVVIGDMVDNMSDHSREEATQAAQRSRTPVYPIILRQATSRGADVAKSLATQTGGLAFNVPNLNSLNEVLQRIRGDIAGLYTVRYTPPVRLHHLRGTSVRVRCLRKGVKAVVPTEVY